MFESWKAAKAGRPLVHYPLIEAEPDDLPGMSPSTWFCTCKMLIIICLQSSGQHNKSNIQQGWKKSGLPDTVKLQFPAFSPLSD